MHGTNNWHNNYFSVFSIFGLGFLIFGFSVSAKNFDFGAYVVHTSAIHQCSAAKPDIAAVENISASGTSCTRAWLGAHDAEANLSLMFPCAIEQFS
jgi:predicted homoserine dehydrogenase-like protein